MWRLIILSLVLLSVSSLVKTRQVDQQKVVERHNYYRKMVGVPDLKYSNECAAYAQKWAENLAFKNNGLKHSGSHKYGENIYWKSNSSNEIEMIDYWAEEKKYFNANTRHHSHKNGHYSQIVWRDTKFVGVGMAIAKDGSEYWVATYYPAGNYIGEKAY